MVEDGDVSEDGVVGGMVSSGLRHDVNHVEKDDR